MKPYPKECPVFRVNVDGWFIRRNAIVECVEIEFADNIPAPVRPDQISVRAVNPKDVICPNAVEAKRCVAALGYYGCHHAIDGLIPLTPFARAIARGAK